MNSTSYYHATMRGYEQRAPNILNHDYCEASIILRQWFASDLLLQTLATNYLSTFLGYCRQDLRLAQLLNTAHARGQG